MTLLIKSTTENSITLPTWLMNLLKLQEGELAPQWQNVIRRLDEVIATLLKFKSDVNPLPLTIDEIFPPFEAISERIPGLHAGTTWVSDDFDDPLPDEFWLGDTHETLA